MIVMIVIHRHVFSFSVAQCPKQASEFLIELSTSKKTPAFLGPNKLTHESRLLSKSKKHRRLCSESQRIDWYPSWPPSFLAGQYL
jgi:hypothetical protein